MNPKWSREGSWDETTGTLSVYIEKIKNVAVKGTKAYCIVQLEKQQIQTKDASSLPEDEHSYGVWDEIYTLDVTNVAARLNITAYIQESGSESAHVLVGQMKMSIDPLLDGKHVECISKLTLLQQETTAELHMKLHFSKTHKKVSERDFEPLTVVGQGSFAKVMLVRKKDTRRLYAMKIINKNHLIKNNAVKHTLSEKRILMRINHPFIVSLKYCFQSESQLYMVLDYIPGGELFYHLSEAERFDEDRARFYAAEILQALGYLHKLNVVYRDLKPENLLIDMKGHICVTDFGLCKEDLGYGNVTHTFCGSPEYLAPEIFTKNGYDKSVDWWALGTLLYEMLAGLPPFFSEDVQEMNRNIVYGELEFPDFFSEEAKSLLTGLLQKDPKKRLGNGMRDASEIKEHSFFKSIDWQKLELRELDPPFKPNLKSELDVRFFEPEATSQVASYSLLKNEEKISSSEQDFFKDFYYVAPELEYERNHRTSSGTVRITKPLLISNNPNSFSSIRIPSEASPKNSFLSSHRSSFIKEKQ